MTTSTFYEYKRNQSECKLHLRSEPSANGKACIEFRVKRFRLQMPCQNGCHYKFGGRCSSYVCTRVVDHPSSDVSETIALASKESFAKFLHDEHALEFVKDKIANYLKGKHPDSEHETLVASVETLSILLDKEGFKKACRKLTMESCGGEEDEGSLDRCAICLGDLQVGFVLVTACSHEFHFSCIIPWLAKKRSCPMCRHRVSKRR